MATEAEAKSLSELEREAEHTRADLIHTVDELHSRVSPQAIKEEVKAYARETSQDFIYGLERRARENPLQTIAVAAAVAYPVWRFLINIPAPILMVGAGLALAQVGGGERSRRSHADNGLNDSSNLTDMVKRTVQDASSKMSDAAENLKEKAASAALEAKSAVISSVNALGGRATAAINDASTAASDTAAAARETLSGTYQSGVDAAARTADQLTETFRQSKDTLLGTIENHPLVVGGIGLLIGAAIASALPVTQAENSLFGGTSDDLKNRARDMASEGLHVAQAAAQDVYEGSVSRAQEQGLSVDAVRRTVQDVGEKVTNVVEQARESLDKMSSASNRSNT